MDNRRNDYRHPFAPDDRLRVELSFAGGQPLVTGQIVNLSLGGLACVVEGSFRLDPARPVVAHFAIPHGLRRFAIPCAVVRGGAGSETDPVRLHFLPLDNPTAQDDREKALCVFLFDEQRRERWRRLGRP